MFYLFFLFSYATLSALFISIEFIGQRSLQEIVDEYPRFFWPLHWKKGSKHQATLFSNRIKESQEMVLITAGVVGLWSIQSWHLSPFFTFAIIPTILTCRWIVERIALKSPKRTLKVLLWPAFFLLFLCSPYLLFQLLFRTHNQEAKEHSYRRKLLQLLHEMNREKAITTEEFQQLLSIIRFQSKSCRELMIPRMHVCTLEETTRVGEALALFLKENYSRMPVVSYSRKSPSEEVVGLLYIKDLIAQPEDLPIQELIRPVLFAPETKKAALLLKEFQQKGSHMAVIVDEYGSMEGVITIEDLLEEIVGEIFDEYDERDEKGAIVPIEKETWLIEASTKLLTIEEELSILFPKSSEYDTLSGLICTLSGSIPEVGYKIFLDSFELEIVEGDERHVSKVKLSLLQESID